MPIINSIAGLWDGQTDEQELGMTYDEIEWAIKHDNEELYDKDMSKQRKNIVLDKVRRMRKINAHKLKYPPVFNPTVE